MAWQLYVIPYETILSGPGTGGRRPKYVTALGVRWNGMDYGKINWALVAADVTPAQDASLTANSDVRGLPENLDALVGAGALTAVKNFLEASLIPADWITAATSYRAIVRAVGGLFQFAQRYHGDWDQDLIPNQAALDLRWNQIAQARRDRIVSTAASLGLDLSGIPGSTLVRTILKNLADLWGARALVFNPEFQV